MKKTGAEILWECLLRENVDTVFGFPGGNTLPLHDALHKYPIHHVLVRHEQGASHMADAYARVSGKVGVAIATSGPGATNLVTGIATAMMDSSPIVCITGQVNSSYIGYDAFQETDVTGITLPITKHNYLVSQTSDIAPVIREAFYIARSGRPGPVLVDITKDAQVASIEWEYDDSPIELPGYRPDLRPVNSDMEYAAELIREAKRPLILAGAGVIKSDALKELKEYAEKTDTPIALTLLGIGAIPTDHPLNLGMMGMHGHAWVNRAIQEADLLLAFGMRFDDRVTGRVNAYAPTAKKIHFDIDPSEINKNVKVDLALIGDLKESMQKLLPHLESQKHSQWLQQITEYKTESSPQDIQQWPDNGRLFASHVINDIWKLTEGKALVVTDVGQNQMLTAQYYLQDEPNSFITSGGLGTMGFAIPAAIGAKFAKPEAEVWAFVGDGGFQMTQAELATAAQEGIKINIALLNNGYLGMVRQWQEFFYESRYIATPITGPDFVKLAEAHGLLGIRVTKREEVEAAVRTAQAHPGTVLIEFQVEPEENVYPMVSAGSELHKMILRPSDDA